MTEKAKKKTPTAASVDREPSNEPTPKGHAAPVHPDDEPKGHPTSDRFRSESPQTDKSDA